MVLHHSRETLSVSSMKHFFTATMTAHIGTGPCLGWHQVDCTNRPKVQNRQKKRITLGSDPREIISSSVHLQQELVAIQPLSDRFNRKQVQVLPHTPLNKSRGVARFL